MAIQFDRAELRDLLIDCARRQRTITYGEVAARNRVAWSQGASVALVSALNDIDRVNRLAGEPRLMALVVSKSSGMPGPGFFKTVGIPPTAARHFFEEERRRAFAHFSGR